MWREMLSSNRYHRRGPRFKSDTGGTGASSTTSDGKKRMSMDAVENSANGPRPSPAVLLLQPRRMYVCRPKTHSQLPYLKMTAVGQAEIMPAELAWRHRITQGSRTGLLLATTRTLSCGSEPSGVTKLAPSRAQSMPARKTRRPSTQVCTTRGGRSGSNGPSRTTRSARFPGVKVPRSCSWPPAYAAPAV